MKWAAIIHTYIHSYIHTYIGLHTYIRIYIHTYTYTYLYTHTNIHIHTFIQAGFKKRKAIRNLFEIATHFGKVIRNCESLFATYSHYCIIYINVSKKGEILSKKGVRTKKCLFAIPFEK